MKIYGHPRSGVNYATALIGQVFFNRLEFSKVRTGHWSKRVYVQAPNTWLSGFHGFYTKQMTHLRIYAYRDGRDVAYALWRTPGFRSEDLAFSDFLRLPLDWYESPGKALPARKGLTIVEHWKRHLDSWRAAERTYFLRYEDLLTDKLNELALLSLFLDRKLFKGTEPIGDVGPFPSGDYRVSKWQECFTAKDLDYFFSIVPKDFWGLYED